MSYGVSGQPSSSQEDVHQWQPDTMSCDPYPQLDDVKRGLTLSSDDAWQTPMSCDPYAKPDDVTRGLSLSYDDAMSSDPFFHHDDNGLRSSKLSGFSCALESDPYREPDEVTKGISIGFNRNFDDVTLPKGLQNLAFDGVFNEKALDLNMASGLSSSVLDKQVDDTFDNARRFQSDDVPPHIPSDPFWKLEITTLSIVGEPYEIANHLLDYLSLNSKSSGFVNIPAKPVRHKKYAVKADIFEGKTMSMCTAKIRIYKYRAEPGYAVEYQCRSGDRIAFSQSFQGAAAYFKSIYRDAVRGPEITAPISFLPPPMLEDHKQFLTEAELTPLIDMAEVAEDPMLQAESAGSLCQLAADGYPAVCTGSVFAAIPKLIQASSIAVAVPTAALIYHLAQRQEAVPFFASHDLMATMLDKIVSNDTRAQVRLQLAEALNAAIQRQPKVAAADSAKEKLLRSLCEYLRGPVTISPEVQRNLSECRSSLERS